MDYIVVPPKIVSEPLRSRCSLTILYGNDLFTNKFNHDYDYYYYYFYYYILVPPKIVSGPLQAR